MIRKQTNIEEQDKQYGDTNTQKTTTKRQRSLKKEKEGKKNERRTQK